MDESSDVEARLWELTAARDIEYLMSAYGAACDMPLGEDRGRAVSDCFTEDGIWEGLGLGATVNKRCESRTAIRQWFSRTDRYTFTVHYITNPRVEVHGQDGYGRFLNFGPLTYHDSEPYWQASQYENDFQYVDGAWRIKHLRARPYLMTPFHEGWVKQRYAQLP